MYFDTCTVYAKDAPSSKDHTVAFRYTEPIGALKIVGYIQRFGIEGVLLLDKAVPYIQRSSIDGVQFSERQLYRQLALRHTRLKTHAL